MGNVVICGFLGTQKQMMDTEKASTAYKLFVACCVWGTGNEIYKNFTVMTASKILLDGKLDGKDFKMD